jgi:hypothetical protein
MRFSHHYYEAHDTRAVVDSAHINGRPSDISGSLLLLSIIATDSMTSKDCCYCGARGTRVGATSAHSTDGSSDINGSLLLPPTIAIDRLTTVDHCYYHPP